jgi:hypothetical protein
MRIDEVHTWVMKICDTNLRRSGITPVRILKWLNNFDENDWHFALQVAENITYISEEEIYELFKNRIETLIENIDPDKNIYLVPSKARDSMEGFGKSSQLMSYYLKKVVDDFDVKIKKRIHFFSHARAAKKKKKELNENSIVVVYDDFIGSGKQISTFIKTVFFKEFKAWYENVHCFKIISLFATRKGIRAFEKELPNIKIITEERIRAFAENGSVFGYKPKMLPVREFCYRYGKKFFIWQINNHIKEKKGIPMGYENSQELLVFCYRTPNNTLPIIWSGQNNWFPLFPRFVNNIIQEAKDFRKEAAHLLSRAKKLGYSDIITGRIKKKQKTLDHITQNDVMLLCVMRLKRAQSTAPVICQKLNIRIRDYEEVMADGISRNFFDSDGQFTTFGLDLYKKIISLKSEYDDPFYWKENFSDPDKVLYIPKKFNGKA